MLDEEDSDKDSNDDETASDGDEGNIKSEDIWLKAVMRHCWALVKRRNKVKQTAAHIERVRGLAATYLLLQ